VSLKAREILREELFFVCCTFSYVSLLNAFFISFSRDERWRKVRGEGMRKREKRIMRQKRREMREGEESVFDRRRGEVFILSLSPIHTSEASTEDEEKVQEEEGDAKREEDDTRRRMSPRKRRWTPRRRRTDSPTKEGGRKVCVECGFARQTNGFPSVLLFPQGGLPRQHLHGRGREKAQAGDAAKAAFSYKMGLKFQPKKIH
jgi:hypothetical protein